MSEEARLEKKQRIQENRERRAAAAAVVGVQQQATELEGLLQDSLYAGGDVPMPSESVLQPQPPVLPPLDSLPQESSAPVTFLSDGILSPVGPTPSVLLDTSPAAPPLAALPNTFIPATLPAATAPVMMSATASQAAIAEKEQAIVAQVAAAARACVVQQAVGLLSQQWRIKPR